MTHTVHPYIFRIGQVRVWKSRWFNRKKFTQYLREDTFLREWLEKKLRQAHIASIEIERSTNTLHVIIKTSRPGVLIGRSGEGAEKLKEDIKKKIFLIWRKTDKKPEKSEIRLSIEEVRSPETHASIVAQMIIDDIEKRVAFRRIMKQRIEKVSSSREVKGVKIALKGRLDGSEMARYEWLKKGRIPLQTMRADVDYAEKTAFTTYGTVGVKVWIYKGDVFEKDKVNENKI